MASSYALFSSTLLAASLLAGSTANAQSSASSALTPLASKKFTYPNIPYQVTGDNGGIRGPQAGYNLCNSTTEGAQSECQTMFLNDITDFCMWSSPKQNDTVGQSEAYEVAWCTKPGHGTRVIPPGTITGAQWLYAKDYVQVVGFLNQANVNLAPSDEGGELDPHGADEQGNPLGGLVYTNGFGQNAAGIASQIQGGLGSKAASSPANGSYTQVIEWIDFIGGGIFCLKMCNPSDPQAPQLCNHIYDEVGCNYNAIANYAQINGTFTVCDSDDMSPPGVYEPAPGQTSTWFQPTVGPVGTPPYTTSVPSSSNCQTFSSNQLFAAEATAAGSTSGSSATATGKSGSGGSSGSQSAGASSPSSSSGSNAAPAAIGFSIGLVFVAAIIGGSFTLMA